MPFARRNWQIVSTWLLTLVIVSGGFAAYFYIYVEGRRHYFTAKRLRDLHFVGSSLKLRVENIANKVIPNAISESKCGIAPQSIEVAAGQTAEPGVAGATINTSSQPAKCDVARLEEVTALVNGLSFETGAEGQSLANIGQYVMHIDVEPDPDGPVLVFALVPQPALPDASHRPLVPQPSQPGAPHRPKDELRAILPMKQVLGSYNPDSFDELLLVDDHGAVLFHAGSAQVEVTNLATVITRQNDETVSDSHATSGAWSATTASSQVWTRNLAGFDYLVFTEPIHIALEYGEGSAEHGTSAVLPWTISGLVQKDRLTQQSYVVSYTLVVIFLFVFLILLVAWPFLKVLTLGAHDRLARYDVILVCFAGVLTTALVTFFTLDVYAYDNLERRLDLQLRELAHEIKGNFYDDVQSLLRTTQVLTRLPLPTKDTPKTPINSLAIAATEDAYGAAIKKALLSGSFFQRAVWIDNNGQQIYKRSVGKPNTSLILVRERQYFRNIIDRHTWTIPASLTGPQTSIPVAFSLEPVISWTTGETVVTLTVPTPPQGAEPWVLGLDVDLPSLRHAVLPPGYGFAILDSDGLVLFHSDEDRHWQENFLVECDDNAELRAAMFARSDESFSGHYIGKDHRFYVTTLSSAGGPPWILVVFRDKLWLRTANVEALSVALIIFAWLVVLLLPVFLTVWMNKDKTDWLWPKRTHIEFYPILLSKLIAAAILFFIAIWTFSPVALAYTSFVIPPIALLFTRWQVGGEFRSSWIVFAVLAHVLIAGLWLVGASGAGPLIQVAVLLMVLFGIWLVGSHGPIPFRQHAKSLGLKRGYRLTIAALLLLVGVLPAVACFKLAYERELNLYVKHGQLRLAKTLERRRDWLAAKFAPLKGGDQLSKEWSQQNRDVFASIFFPCSKGHGSTEATPSESDREFAHSAIDRDSILDQFLALSRPFYNDAAKESHDLFHNAAADLSYWWSGNLSTCLILHTRDKDIQQPPVRAPSWWRPASPRLLVGALLGVAVLVLLVSRIALVIARELFLLGVFDESSTPFVGSQPFDALWRARTSEEQLALHDLAADGFINRNNPAIEGLLKEGLLLFSPMRIYDDGFRDFIKREGAKHPRSYTVTDKTPSLWQMLKWPLSIVVIASAGFLFFSQRHVFDTSIGFIGALVTSLTGVYKLIEVLRNPGRGQ